MENAIIEEGILSRTRHILASAELYEIVSPVAVYLFREFARSLDMRGIFGCALLTLILAANDSQANIWHVKPDSTGDAINIQAGIDSTGSGDTVLVAPGIYRGNGNRDIDFKGKPIVVLSACRYDTTITDSTVIDCGGSADPGHRGFHFHSGETNSSILEGFAIVNGYYFLDSKAGAGIRCDSSSSPIIRHNTIKNCDTWFGGSGIYCEFSSPAISFNKIYGNGAQREWMLNSNQIDCLDPVGHGGGISCYVSSAIIRNNKIFDNGTCEYGKGGGISCVSCSSITIYDNDIYDNICYSNGGGIYLCSSTATIERNDVTHNRSYHDFGGTGGIFAEACSLTIRNNSISQNLATWEWGGTGGLYLGNCIATLENNRINDNYSSGMECQSSGVTMDHNEINYNQHGGAWLNCSASSRITNNSICHNGARWGGLYYSGISATIVSNNIISDNFGSYGMFTAAGGIGCSNSSPEISNNLIVRNRSRFGAGIRCKAASPRIINNTIVGNMGWEGAGVYIDSLSSPILAGNIIANNFVDYEGELGGGIYSESRTVTISCNDVYDNEGGDYIGIPDQTGMNGNFSLDPLFCDVGNDEYGLLGPSPCLPGNHPGGVDCGLIGAFGPCEIATLLADFRAETAGSAIAVTWRLSETARDLDFFVLRADMPGKEYREIPNAAIDRDGLSFVFEDKDCEPGAIYRYRVDVSDERGRRILFETDAVSLAVLPLALHQNYPNPFNPSTTLAYFLPAKCRVTLEIYDISGKLIAQVLNGEQEHGSHTAQWHGVDERGNSVASGVYFCRLRAGKETLSRKLVLLR